MHGKLNCTVVTLAIKGSKKTYMTDEFYMNHIENIYKMMDYIIYELQRYEYENDIELLREVPTEDRTSIWIPYKLYFRFGDLIGFTIYDNVICEATLIDIIKKAKIMCHVKETFSFAMIPYSSEKLYEEDSLYYAIPWGEKISKKSKKII